MLGCHAVTGLAVRQAAPDVPKPTGLFRQITPRCRRPRRPFEVISLEAAADHRRALLECSKHQMTLRERFGAVAPSEDQLPFDSRPVGLFSARVHLVAASLWVVGERQHDADPSWLIIITESN